jgi:hypothetical protein
MEKKKGARRSTPDSLPYFVVEPMLRRNLPDMGRDYILAAVVDSAAEELLSAAASEAMAEPVSVASTAASVDAAFSPPVQPARAKEVPTTAARMSLRMRYNPWIEVNRAGQAARRKAYSGDRLRGPINRQFIALQAFNAPSPPPLSYT